jgi:hypothetical protein
MTVSLLAGLGLGLIPAAAHADTLRTATATGWGADQGTAAATAESNARYALASQASQAGEVCSNVTTSSTLIYVVPSGGGDVFSATATGLCGPPQPVQYTVARSATVQAQGRGSGEAVANGERAARASILSVGINCTNWATTATYVYATPDGWNIYNVTVTALCTN